MAPVGSYESLMAAIQGGADSIYFGIEGLNMRSRSSNNFTTDDLRKIVAICQEHCIKSYITVNTVIYGEDVTDSQAAAIEEQIMAKYGDKTEITVIKGGQPIYYYIISVE